MKFFCINTTNDKINISLCGVKITFNKNVKCPDEITQKKYSTIKSIIDWQKKKTIAPIAPIVMQIELSNLCNIKCLMCSFFSPFVNKDALNSYENDRFISNDIISKLDSLLQQTLYVSLFGYGEPLIHPNFKECIEKIGKYKVFSTFFTNAKKLDKKTAELLVDQNVGKITISFTGANKDVYENIYLGNNFEDVLSNIKYLSDYKKLRNKKYPIIEVNSLGFQSHVNELDKFMELMSEIGVNNVILHPLNASLIDCKVLSDEVCIVRPDIEGQIIKKAKQIAQAKGIIFSDILSSKFTAANEEEDKRLKKTLTYQNTVQNEPTHLCEMKDWLKEHKIQATDKKYFVRKSFLKNDSYEEILSGLDPIDMNTSFKCTQPHTVMYVMQNGMVKACCNMPPTSINMLGDISQINTAEEIWNWDTYKLFRENIDKGLYPKKYCQACIKTKIYPDADTYKCIINEYRDWYKSSFGIDPFSKVVKKINNIRRK